MTKYNFPANRIFNVDETGVTTVLLVKFTLRVPTGVKQVGKATSGERGQNVTVVCAFSATGTYTPPMFMYPLQRLKASLSAGGPPEAIYECSKSGWINEELFFKWLQHFAQHSGAHKDNPTLLVLDNHSSHQSLSSFEFSRDNGIHILSIPAPHVSYNATTRRDILWATQNGIFSLVWLIYENASIWKDHARQSCINFHTLTHVWPIWKKPKKVLKWLGYTL